MRNTYAVLSAAGRAVQNLENDRKTHKTGPLGGVFG